MIFPVQDVIDNQVTLPKPISEILALLKPGGALKVLSPVEYHTERQRRWYKGVCLRGLSEWNGETPDEWDFRLKMLCGGDKLLKTETFYHPKFGFVNRLTTVGVSKKNMTAFIENILSKAIEKDWPVTPPDESLRK